MRDLQIYF